MERRIAIIVDRCRIATKFKRVFDRSECLLIRARTFSNRPDADAGGADIAELHVREVVARVRDQIGPAAAFKLACVVDRLPKTRSGKILRATMVKIADGEDFRTPATIDDPAILDEIRTALKGVGYPKA